MKADIHPTYYKAIATCACGAQYEIDSLKESIRIDICSACHPLFTGKQKLVDAEGRVDRFKRRYSGEKKTIAISQAKKERAKVVKTKKAEKKSAKKKVTVRPKAKVTVRAKASAEK